jgi:hypothetical protein
VLIDVLDSHGMMLSRQRLVLRPASPPVLIGRDLACDIVLNDPYVAARHAALSLREDGTVGLDDLGSVNGLILGDERVRQAVIAGPAASHVQVGHSHLRIRTATEPLAPERPDLESLRSRHREYGVAALGGLLCAGFAGLTAWISAPDDPSAALVVNVLRGGAFLGGWFGFWVLVGRAVRSRWLWTANAAIALGAAGAALWLWWGSIVAVFASGQPRLGTVGAVILMLTAAVAIYLHVRTATRLRRSPAAAIATVLPLLGCAGWLWYQQQHTADVNYVTPPAPIFPPAWSRQPGVRLDKFLEDGLDLRDVADQQRPEGQVR